MILKQGDKVRAVGDKIEKVSNGYLIDNRFIIPNGEVLDIEHRNQTVNINGVDKVVDIIADKYYHSDERGFYISPEWEQSIEEEVKKALAEFLEMEA